MAGIKFNAIYKNTTIDPSGTIKHAKENGVIIVKPRNNFFKSVEQKGLPLRKIRWCCQLLKEYKIADVAIQGIRRDESAKRAERYKEPNYCRMYTKTQKTHVWLPILEWTKEDVALFINSEKIQCHSLYYDTDGVFRVERRLGCIGCPIASRKHRINELKQHPLFVREYVKRIKIFMWNQIEKKGFDNCSFAGANNEYEMVTMNIFCDSIRDFEIKFGGMFGRLDCKQFLEDYFKIDLP